MRKEVLQEHINNELSTRKIADAEITSQTNVRYWLKKYGLRTAPKQYLVVNYLCNTCGETDAKNFYGNNKVKCSICTNKVTTNKEVAQKEFAVTTLGGKCSTCSYNKCIAALEIHHLQPELKSSDFHNFKRWNRERLLEELKTCVLLCANCHREAHHLVTKLSNELNKKE